MAPAARLIAGRREREKERDLLPSFLMQSKSGELKSKFGFFLLKTSQRFSMPPLTLRAPRFGAAQRQIAPLRRAEAPVVSAPSPVERRRRSKAGNNNDAIVASALGGDANGVASTSTSSPSSSTSIADAKASLRAAAPAARNGDPTAISLVLAAVERLAELSTTASFPAPAEPSTWETLFTDAKQGSNGKVGPFQGEARQLFAPGSRFLNRVSIPSEGFAVLKADFGGRWEQRPNRNDRVEVIFEESNFYIFGLRVAGSEFPPPGQKGSLKGHWTMKFADDDVRAFVTNKMSVVVLGRVVGES